jgi:hypothetical protein
VLNGQYSLVFVVAALTLTTHNERWPDLDEYMAEGGLEQWRDFAR